MHLKGKKALIMGLANERRLAWGIANALKKHGAELGFTYIDAIEQRMRPLAESLGATFIEKCDVASDSDIESVAQKWTQKCGGSLDILIHSLAYAEREDLEKDFVETSRKGFLTAIDISAYSLVGVTRAFL